MGLSLIEVFQPGEDIFEHSIGNFANIIRPIDIRKPKKNIQLRDYQDAAYSAVIRDFESGVRSCLVVLATGLGKTILFSKIIDEWTQGRVLVLQHLEELLQNAYQEISEITGEIIGIERGPERNDHERVTVSLIQTLQHTYQRFSRDYFSLIIIDEAHHSASDIYRRVLEYFSIAKVVGLTATDARSDGKHLPFQRCSFRMGIAEGIGQGYLVPVRGRRVIIDSIDLTRVKKKATVDDFDDSALDDEMVKGAAAIADVIYNDWSFDKGILFFPGCASAKLTSEFLNKKSEGLSVYIDGKITGKERRSLVSRLRNGQANWLCNVGIATEGFNWPEASVVGMCCPTLSRSAYVQRAGRGTRPEAGLLDGIQESGKRIHAILNSSKPYMTILDFVGVSANLNLITHESFLQDTDQSTNEQEKQRQEEEDPGDEQELEEQELIQPFGFSRIASGIQSRTLHSIEEFDAVEGLGCSSRQTTLELKTAIPKEEELLSEKQYNLLKKFGIDDPFLTRRLAQPLVGFIFQHNCRLSGIQRNVLKKLYKDANSKIGTDG
jgi:superfamily II DNA or RNA helicase